MDGETEYFQVSKNGREGLFLDRLLDPILLYIVLVLQNNHSTPYCAQKTYSSM